MPPRTRVTQQGWDKALQEAGKKPASFIAIASENVRTVALEAQRNIKMAMPVRTGRARASWGSPNVEGIWEVSDNGMTIEQGTNVHYVQYLNEGSSKQAPAGFIDSEAVRAEIRLITMMEQDIARGWK